ncbi:DUF4336 domain-containing protein [Methylobrevis pamukkalensis]|uniref:DUF4336 domain-containing protein n=1 Tax=Methylobrevis pamukkalensis TaxID=1439726 RepID=A0A1E3H635_9HYPH|nr:DUF4336 domain-containing protein [Methylobrevis pamukkalensis]ODN71774.1 hypothetical protein A6302_00917 [Methylobrevis pamukkalensis]
MTADRVTYPPLDLPKAVAENIWVVDSGPLKAMGLFLLPVRMTVVRLTDGSLLLHSPTRCDAALRRRLGELGPVRHLVAPNSAHWTFLEAWQAEYPSATTWAAPGLRDRSQVKKAGVRLDLDLDEADPMWPGDLNQIHVTGLGGFHEVCLHHRASNTLILTDLVQNLEPEKLAKATRPLAALAGVTAPDGRAPIYLRAIVRAKGEPARAAARQLLALRPERVIFAHGRWFDTEATACLERSLRWLL